MENLKVSELGLGFLGPLLYFALKQLISSTGARGRAHQQGDNGNHEIQGWSCRHADTHSAAARGSLPHSV